MISLKDLEIISFSEVPTIRIDEEEFKNAQVGILVSDGIRYYVVKDTENYQIIVFHQSRLNYFKYYLEGKPDSDADENTDAGTIRRMVGINLNKKNNSNPENDSQSSSDSSIDAKIVHGDTNPDTHKKKWGIF